MALRKLPTRYHGYDCTKDPRRLFTPKELASMREYDKVVNAHYQGRMKDRITRSEMDRGCALVLRGMTAFKALALIRSDQMNRAAKGGNQP